MTTTTILHGISCAIHAALGDPSRVAAAEMVRDRWHLLGYKVPFVWTHLHASDHHVYVKGWMV